MNRKYWTRTQMGLENILYDELIELGSINNVSKTHRNVFFETVLKPKKLCTLRIADDIYFFLGKCDGITNKRDSLDTINSFFNKTILSELEFINGSIRVTGSFVGKRNFSRFEMEEKINQSLLNKKNLNVLSNQNKDKWFLGENRLRIHLEDDYAYFGLSLTDRPLHRREWRLDSYDGQLHPCIAAAIVRVANLSHLDEVIDPFCGSGTILVELGIKTGIKKLHGFDINKKAIKAALGNSENSEIDLMLENSEFDPNVLKKPYFIVSNPPWGEKHSLNYSTELKFIEFLVSIFAKSQVSVILVPQSYTEKLKLSMSNVQRITTTRVKGLLVDIVKISNENSSSSPSNS